MGVGWEGLAFLNSEGQTWSYFAVNYNSPPARTRRGHLTDSNKKKIQRPEDKHKNSFNKCSVLNLSLSRRPEFDLSS